MEIVFELDKSKVTGDPEKVASDFCDAVVRSIRQNILEGMIPIKYPAFEQGLINASWINWTEKPSKINIEKLIYAILRCIKWSKLSTKYRIYIDPTVRMPQTLTTTLEQIARYIDKGNNITKQSTLFSRVFNKYDENIQYYWKLYVEFGRYVDTNRR